MEEQNAERKKERNELLEWAKAFLVAFAIAAIIRYFLFIPIVVDGESMMPTLNDGDKMIVNKLDKPDRFDVVVFHATESKDYIKRIIGLPGDYVEYKDDQLYINGKKYDEPYLDEYKSQITSGTLTNDFTLKDIDPTLDKIPEGYYLVLGDNRRFSSDSRVIGLIKEEDIIGTTKVVFWPFNKIRIVE